MALAFSVYAVVVFMALAPSAMRCDEVGLSVVGIGLNSARDCVVVK